MFKIKQLFIIQLFCSFWTVRENDALLLQVTSQSMC